MRKRIAVFAEQQSASSTISPFELAALPCRAAVLLMPEKSEHVLLRHAERSFQLAVSGADILQLFTCVPRRSGAALSMHRLWATCSSSANSS
ncbi:hypothetical protein NKH98_28295 [Mesorhizobium sp. M0833]|uniref:hypothetical protein n=1 Tax=Mesorhizobium sp. M0833 TaxID=2957009 RepID=UPI0033355B7E